MAALAHWHSERVAQEAKNNVDTEAGASWLPVVSNSLGLSPLCPRWLLGQVGVRLRKNVPTSGAIAST